MDKEELREIEEFVYSSDGKFGIDKDSATTLLETIKSQKEDIKELVKVVRIVKDTLPHIKTKNSMSIETLLKKSQQVLSKHRNGVGNV